MALSYEQYDLLSQTLEAVKEDDSKLNDWEKGFMADQQTRFEQYDKRMFISEKQMGIVTKIYDKIMGNPDSVDTRFGRRR